MKNKYDIRYSGQTNCLTRPWLMTLMTLLANCYFTNSAVSDPFNPIVNDPTRPSQEYLITPEFRSQKPKEGFSLPPAPKSSNVQQGEARLVIKKIEFEGNTVITNDELQKIAQPFLQHRFSARDLEELRQQITTRYVDAGYINSGAVIPAQSAANGVLHINIVEGKLTEVRLQGMGRLRDYYLKDRLLVGAGTPLNLKSLQDKYQLLLADPLIERLNGSLLPGRKPGESILTVKVIRARPYQLYADADDYITPSVGTYAGHIGGWVDNLTGFGEHIDADFIVSGGAIGFNTGLDVPINAYDTHMTFRYSDTHTNLVEQPVNLLKIKTNVTGYDFGINQPFYRAPGIDFKAGINFAVRQSNSSFLGQPYTFTEGLPFGEGSTQVTVLRLWQQLMLQGSNNALVFRSTSSKGLNALGATIQHGLLPSGDFFSWLGQTQYTHKVMDNGAQVAFRGSVQLAANSLLPLERFSVGGVYTVRGYRENYYVRDNGFNTGLEFRYPLFGGSSGATHNLFLIPFVDYGGAWNNPTQADLKPKKNYLNSVGMGFNWRYNHVATDFYWAHAMTSVPTLTAGRSIQDDGIHFKVSLFAF